MFERLLAAMSGRLATTSLFRQAARRTVVAMLTAAVAALWLVPTAATGQQKQAPAQMLTWTAGNSITEYLSAPTTATAGTATIVFENSEATGNTMGMSHTLTFDTATPGYNHDVDINIVASPFDSNGGRHEVQVNLTPGKYRYYCAIPGHGQMTGELVVTEADGGGGEDTTAPQVSAEVAGEQDADGNYVGTTSVTLSATDSGSGVDTIEYALDTTEFTPYTEPLTVDQPGTHALDYRATDTAGNTSAVKTVEFTITEDTPEDTTAPQVSAEVVGEQDTDGNYVGTTSVTLSATDSGSGVKTVEYAVDGTEFTTYSEPVTLDRPGEHTVRYRATDTAGNVSPVATTAFAITEPAPEDCPGSDTRETVIIDGRDTGVDNAETENGCTINDLIAEDATYPNHGAFVRHVALVTDGLEASGTISGNEKGRIMSAAGRSDIGK